jgi:large subunit ribosomal protein L15
MQNHTLKRLHKNKKARQVGREGGRGKTSGRGTKGQNARSGHKKRPEIRDFIKRIPKMRGRGKNSNLSVWSKPVAINLRDIAIFKAGEIVSPETLISKNIIKKEEARFGVKILGLGEIKVKLTVTGCKLSSGARNAIESAGGTVK